MHVSRYVYTRPVELHAWIEDESGRRYVTQTSEVEITIQLDRLAEIIGRAAVANTTGRASARYGAIKARVLK